MHTRIVIVEKTRVKTLCLSVLNDDNTEYIKSANVSTFIFGTYSELILFFIQTTKLIIIMTKLWTDPFQKNLQSSLLFCITQVYPLEYFRFHIRTQQNNLSITFTF